MYERHTPPPRTRAEEARAWVRTCLPLLGFAMLLYGGSAFLRELRTSPPPSALATNLSAGPLSPTTATPAATPFTVIFPDAMTLITVTETPLPQTPTPPQATPVGIDICTNNTPKGIVCKQPPPPLPPPTEIPDCPVNIGAYCVSTGQPVQHLPTSTPMVVSYPPGEHG